MPGNHYPISLRPVGVEYPIEGSGGVAAPGDPAPVWPGFSRANATVAPESKRVLSLNAEEWDGKTLIFAMLVSGRSSVPFFGRFLSSGFYAQQYGDNIGVRFINFPGNPAYIWSVAGRGTWEDRLVVAQIQVVPGDVTTVGRVWYRLKDDLGNMNNVAQVNAIAAATGTVNSIAGIGQIMCAGKPGWGVAGQCYFAAVDGSVPTSYLDNLPATSLTAVMNYVRARHAAGDTLFAELVGDRVAVPNPATDYTTPDLLQGLGSVQWQISPDGTGGPTPPASAV